MRRVGLIVVPDIQMMNFGALSVFELPNARSGEAHLCELVSADRVAAWNVVNQVIADEDLYREAHAFAARLV